MRIEMGKKYINKSNGEIFKPICIDRDSIRYPVVMESEMPGNDSFSKFTTDGRSGRDELSSLEEYIPEPEPIAMDGMYLSDGREVKILTLDSGHLTHPVVAMFRDNAAKITGPESFSKTGFFLCGGDKSRRDLIKIGEKKVESKPEMVVYKVKYHNPDRGYYETGVIASPAASLYPWFGKIGTQHESVEELGDLKYTGDSTEPVVIG